MLISPERKHARPKPKQRLPIRRLIEDALANGDGAAWNRFLADVCVLTCFDGTRVTKLMTPADLKEGALKIESFQLDDVKVRVYQDAAVVTGQITSGRNVRLEILRKYA